MNAGTMTADDLKQKLNMVIITFFNLYGIIPSANDLYQRLGLEYAPLIEAYSSHQSV